MQNQARSKYSCVKSIQRHSIHGRTVLHLSAAIAQLLPGCCVSLQVFWWVTFEKFIRPENIHQKHCI